MKYLAVWKEVSYPYYEIEADSPEEAERKAQELYQQNGIPEDYLDEMTDAYQGIEEA